MVKSFFLTYGTNDVGVDELGQRIASALGMQFELRESLYAGAYVNCVGSQADTLRIVPNEVNQEIVREKFREYSVLVEISNLRGKNVDKEARTLYVKQVLGTMPELTLLDDIQYLE
ncbi:hypothetical protein J0X19_01295 [Hymenobacter sp. BT186]|uniref:Uncharacterized protein n=1 Tax=Hymenobacter telluris TaxID=2816474 RepID=A0A939ESC1_9BACT|nr:hypothetical protein [Hymenobacter telluris]MBO0356568.1 hypothetical protein [Hymenobacter telluris]MBW3372593.1 hypothetical protein [Hymenobacter norwichensis]